MISDTPRHKCSVRERRGLGEVHAFADDGHPIGVFRNDPRIVDLRGLGVDPVVKRKNPIGTLLT
jgi:hypothetical protein